MASVPCSALYSRDFRREGKEFTIAFLPKAISYLAAIKAENARGRKRATMMESGMRW